MSQRVLCKFFLHGACLKGENCEFSHDWKDQPNNVCTYYQKGICSYGSRCRYDHVKVSRNQAPVRSSSSSLSLSSSLPARSHVAFNHNQDILPGLLLWDAESEPHLSSLTDSSALGRPLPVDQPICSFAAAGSCPYGENCSRLHGDLCSICGKQCLHPYRPDEREEHIKLCQKNNKRLEALKLSQEMECSVCLERVLSKPKAAERKFGLLSECDHPFCISCIRNWRSNSPDSHMDVNAALRACPICRKLSYFVIPSVIWYSTQEEKQDILNSYKAKLKSIDCKYFDFGNGNCPFGTSCFYRHAYRDGRLEEVVLRHLDAEDGKTVIAKDIRLSDFFSGLHL